MEMRLADSVFNIRVIGSDEIPKELLRQGCVTVLGSPSELGKYAHKVYNDILKGIDIKSTFYQYDFRINDSYGDLGEFLDCNIIAPMPDLVSGAFEVVVATAQPEDLGLAAVVMMQEIENRTRSSIESLIALFALGAPDVYRQAVDDYFQRKSRVNYGSSISFTGRGTSAYATDSSVLGIIPDTAATDKSKRISDRTIRDVYDNLPDRYSDLYERRNPEAAQVLRYSLGVIDQQNLIALLIEAAKTDRRLFQKLHNAKIKIASKYGLKIRQWSGDQKDDFRDQYRFCLYLTNDKGDEKPIKFRNNPSYCIFVMYVLDRFARGMEATALSFNENKKEFKRLYQSLFNEDYEKIDSLCREMIYRPTNENGVVRKGRYDDYIKDINDTMDELVGCPDSISLKVGHGQFLEIPQNQIEIDKNLPKFKFV